jgi:LmbE family N-acetylglucosaminyl deacetylase
VTAVPAAALVIVAHPDDAELGCGGTLAGWAEAGARVTLVVLTDGSKGSHDADVPDTELRDRREAEQRAAAAVLGVADVRFLRQIDGELAEDPALVLVLAAVLRETRPQVVIAHDPWRRYELHPDHLAAGRLVPAALFAAREPRAARSLTARGLAPWRPQALLLFAAQEPDHVQDVTATFDRKVEAVLCHRSQYASSFGIHGAEGERERFVAALRAHAAAAGAGPGRLGEAFKRIVLA